MATRRRSFPLVPLLLFLLAAAAYGRLISDGSPASASATSLLSNPVSAVIRLTTSNSASASSPPAAAPEEKCEQSYGFLPCTTTVLGNLFLVLAYGFLMYKAATFLSAGSELLLEIMGPGLVGGLLLPILGALPDALLVLGELVFRFVSFVSLFCSLMNRQVFDRLPTLWLRFRTYSGFLLTHSSSKTFGFYSETFEFFNIRGCKVFLGISTGKILRVYEG
jgi:hypothetical protein